MPEAPPRLTPSDLRSKKLVVSYSDGEGNLGGVGVALWVPGHKHPHAGVLEVPEEVRQVWDTQMARGRHNDIFEIEAIGPLVILVNYPVLLRGCLWLHFVDNAAALSCLVNGSSSVCEGDVIIGETWRRIQALVMYAWFDRDDSSSNPVDGLARGRPDEGRGGLGLERGWKEDNTSRHWPN